MNHGGFKIQHQNIKLSNLLSVAKTTFRQPIPFDVKQQIIYLKGSFFCATAA